MIKLFRVLTLLWMGIIFTFSSLTNNDLKQLPTISDTITHGAVYFILGALLYFSFRKIPGFLSILIAALYGLSDEFHQSFVPGRTPELKDLIVDTTAALAAVVTIKLLTKLKKSPAGEKVKRSS